MELVAWLEQLYRNNADSLCGYFARRFAGCEAPEDLLQETFVQAARQPRRVHDAVSPRAWLFGIARRVGLRAARRRRSVGQVAELHLATEAAALAADAPAPADGALLDLREAIVRLPPHLQETLALRLRDELTYEEIAEVLQIPVGTVRSRLHMALQQLRAALNREEFPEPPKDEVHA